MAFIFDLSCYTVCFCIILTITRNTWVAVSFLPCSLPLSPRLGLSYIFHRSVVAHVGYSALMYDAQWWTDTACADTVICILEQLEWEDVCACPTGQFVFVVLKRVDCCWICLFTCGRRADHTLQWSVNLGPEVVSPYPRKHSPCWHAGFPLV